METVACHDCDLVHAAVAPAAHEEARCRRCGAALPTGRDNKPHLAMAALATGAVAFCVAASTPIMRLSILGRSVEATLPGSAAYMWYSGSRVAALCVALFTLVFPTALLAIALAAAIGAARPRAPGWPDAAARFARHVAPWAMPEVMLLAALVAYVKVSQLADAVPGPAMYAIAALAVMLIVARNALQVPAALPTPLPKPALARTLALTIAATVCFLPANTLPVLVTTAPGGAEAHTILDGVQALQRSGSWGLAFILLAASFVIPVAKVGVLVYLWAVVRCGAPADPRQCARVFRLVEFIGRWSMLDVFVDAFLVALVQMPPVMDVRPGPGVPFFAATAIFTMLAAKAFDPRLLWNARERAAGHG